MPEDWSSSLYEYIIKSVVIHLDDSNNEVQEEVTKTLQSASKVYTAKFLELVNQALPKFQHPIVCQNLIKWVNENRL